MKGSAGARLLARHRDADSILRRDEVIRVLGGVGNGDLDALDSAIESVAARAVIRGNGAPLSSPTSQPPSAEKTRSIPNPVAQIKVAELRDVARVKEEPVAAHRDSLRVLAPEDV
jgi:hypothetical protein